MMLKKTIIVGFRNSGLAHLERCLYITDLLITSKNYKVVLLLTKKKYSFIKKYKFSNEYVVEFVQDLPEKNPANHYFYDTKFIKNQVISDINLIQKYNPTCVIADHRVSLYIASEYLKKRWILIENAARSRYFLGAFGMPKRIDKSLINFAKIQWAKFNETLIKEQYKSVLDEYNISSNISFVNQIGNPSKILLPDIPLFGEVKKKEDTIYLGPCFWRGFNFTFENNKLSKILSNNPILVTFGGTMFDQERLDCLVSYIEKSGRYAIITTGLNLKNNFQKKIDKIYIAKFLPLAQILPKCSLQICHGGHLTLLNGLIHGIPSICIPYNHDQVHYSETIHELKCGINLNPLKTIYYDYLNIYLNAKKISNEEIFNAINQIENQIFYKQNAISIKKYILNTFSENYRREMVNQNILSLTY